MLPGIVIIVTIAIQIRSTSGFQLLRSPRTGTRTRTKECTYLLSTLSFVDTTEDAPRDIVTIREWAANCGVQTSDGFQLVTSGDYDNGLDYHDADDAFVITTQDLAADSPILYVPNDMLLTGSRARQELGADAYQAEQTLLQTSGPDARIPQFFLFLKVLTEYEKGDQSPMYPWLNSMPRYYSNGASMTDFCFGSLPPYAGELALAEKNRLKQFVTALHEVPFLSLQTIQNADLARWAFAVIHTRYFDLPDGDVGLIPLADFFNHHGGGAETEATITYDDEGNFYAYSTRNVPAGQPLRICYGDPTNQSKLLARYGFLDESSVARFCKIVIHDPSPELVAMGYDTSKMLFSEDGDISPEVWDVLLYQELDREDRQQQQAFYEAHMAGDLALKQQYHQQYFSLTLKALQQHVDYLILELEELCETNWRKDVKRHPRLPLIMSHNEFVKSMFERVQQNLDTMSTGVE